MTRGTFANVRIKNLMVPGTEGGVTLHRTARNKSIYDAAMAYQAEGMPLIVIAGEEYGTGSSRDWAAKGTTLLGVKAVVAKSFERIHRSNLVGMGVLPLQFKEGVDAATLKLDGSETFDLVGVEAGITPQQDVTLVIIARMAARNVSRSSCVSIRRSKSSTTTRAAFCRLCWASYWVNPAGLSLRGFSASGTMNGSLAHTIHRPD